MKHLPSDILHYLAGLSNEDLKFVITHWHKKMTGETLSENGGDCAEGDKPTNSPTPNGEWVCSGQRWVWIPEIG